MGPDSTTSKSLRHASLELEERGLDPVEGEAILIRKEVRVVVGEVHHRFNGGLCLVDGRVLGRRGKVDEVLVEVVARWVLSARGKEAGIGVVYRGEAR